jgi:ABC-2 type transport system ATP-binding protein
LRCVGGGPVLESTDLVSKIVDHADEKEILLNERANPQELLAKLVESGAVITKFEMVEPSLNDIFISSVEN